jgi:hypothetical protein
MAKPGVAVSTIPPTQPPMVPPAGESPAVVPVVSDKAATTGMIDLPAGKELDEASAIALASSRPIRWVVIAGPSDSGKTTLLIALYELFHRSPVAGYLFAGSSTLLAFEERCHLSRIASGAANPDTQRTDYTGEPAYLHLRVRPSLALHHPVDFLFTDVSGEMFEHARDSTTECKELNFLQRAENFLLLLDCEKAVSVDQRWAMVQDCKALLQSCVDSAMLANDCVVNIVWSKIDYFAAAGKDKHQAFREEVERDFLATFSTRLPHLSFTDVAARPTEHPALGFGYGLPKLLEDWITVSPRIRPMRLFPRSVSGTRESELFAARHFGAPSES